MNETLNLLTTRKSVRAYTQEEITQEERDNILRAAIQAPTAGNQQLYTIIEISDKDLKHTMARLCDNQPFIEDAKLVLVWLADTRRWLRAYKMAGCEARKPGLGDLLLAMADSCISAQSAVVAAESMGIGSCYIGDVLENCEEMRKTLNIPPELVPACMVVFGRPTEQQKNRPSPARLPLEAVVRKDKYEDRSEKEMREDFQDRANRNNTPGFDFDAYMKAFCERKYESDFSREMTRSAGVYLEDFTRGCETEKYGIKLGKYRHFKGNEYLVLDVAKHSETLEPMVVYQALYGERETWVRPASMWNETVEYGGKTMKRFEYVG